MNTTGNLVAIGFPEMPSEFWGQWAEQLASLARVEQELIGVTKTLAWLEAAEKQKIQDSFALEKRLIAIEHRLAEIEGKGFAAWSVKRIAQLAALVTGMGTLFSLAVAIVWWVIKHWQ